MLPIQKTFSFHRACRWLASPWLIGSASAVAAVIFSATMNYLLLQRVSAADAVLQTPAAIARLEVSTGEESAPGIPTIKIIGTEGRRQLIVTGFPAAGVVAIPRDLTREVHYSVEPATIATVNSLGVVVPQADGLGRLTVSVQGAEPVNVPLIVERFGNDPPIDFASQIVPIFTKHACNSGGCHGKSGGQNGFRLSLLGFEPGEDYEHLTKEARGRRLLIAAPEESLLLTKASAATPHGGGRLIEKGSPSYALINRWIAEGARPSDPNARRVIGIDAYPLIRVMHPSSHQQVRVMAHYSDGSNEDVTPMAQYEVNAPELAAVDKSGLVTAVERGVGPQRSGTAALMVRYQSQVAVFRATIPLDSPLVKLPSADAFAKNFIDRHVLDNLVSLGLPPSIPCDDATFLRRVSLDIVGRIPTLDESRMFLADADPTKREKAIDRLLENPEYADYFANKWSSILRNKRTDDALHRRGSYSFHAWIRKSMLENKPYNEFVRDILTATGEAGSHPPVIWYRQVTDANQQVEDSSQLFLGLRLQCARCHHHPFEKWSSEDYYQLSAFFSRVGRKKGLQPGEDRLFHDRGTPQANGPKGVVKAAVLGSPPTEIAADQDPRQVLLDWMTAADNPYFARSLVNRYWKHFFSRGLVEPEDDMRLTNPPTNPALLDALAKHFVEHGYDLKDIIRTICRSATYQLSAEPNELNAEDRQSFSRFYPRRLPAEVALDSIDTLAGKSTGFSGTLGGTRAVQLPDSNFNNYFLTVFGRPNGDSACECERVSDANLAQSLHLINSTDILGKLTGNDGRAFRLANEKERDVKQKISELYLVAFSREPTAEETALIETYLVAHAENVAGAYEDLIWSLLNTKEFLFNH